MRKYQIMKKSGLAILLFAIAFFSISIFLPSYDVTETSLQSILSESNYSLFGDDILDATSGTTYTEPFSLSSAIRTVFESINQGFKDAELWDKVVWDDPREFASKVLTASSIGFLPENNGLVLFLTFGLGIIGGLLYVLPNVILMGRPGIKNDHIFHQSATSKGWFGWIVFSWLVAFYILLYFFPDYTVGWAMISDPASEFLKGSPGGRWFLYGLLYCTVMFVMAIRMYVKYRDNRYQTIRTSSVLFFQIGFAFLIPEIMSSMGYPSVDLKEIWPLDYDFFFDWNISSKIEAGGLGIFLIVWGIILTIIVVPIMVYFFGKRWYCSWVCGCGGLAETLGDPYRQLSDKSLKAWKVERWLIHSVLIFAGFMTLLTLYTYFSGQSKVLFLDTYKIQNSYKFLIGSVFAGVIGTGFYPIMGSRVWCRFGCPLAAYLGFVQRFKSRFRITTNGGQCISCGNCSTYCEMGIDVRAYAQRGQNIVRSSCVGCGVCSAVCPRGVLKLENGPNTDKSRTDAGPIVFGNEIDVDI